MTQSQHNQPTDAGLPAIPGALFRIGRFFVRQKLAVVVPRYEVCRWDAGMGVTPLEERVSLEMAKGRCAVLAREAGE